MNILNRIIGILSDILDLDPSMVSSESYLVRDLEAESIDLLEIAVTLNSEFRTDINDEEIFLKNLRIYIDESEASSDSWGDYLVGKYPFLTCERIREMVSDLHSGPVLKVKDLVSYIQFKVGQNDL
ncbi:MAG: phosphopantetheine-binding protein [Desulfobacteraceae bacterium]|jgi:acyl carrier protein